jgi:hypothetical protein
MLYPSYWKRCPGGFDCNQLISIPIDFPGIRVAPDRTELAEQIEELLRSHIVAVSLSVYQKRQIFEDRGTECGQTSRGLTMARETYLRFLTNKALHVD